MSSRFFHGGSDSESSSSDEEELYSDRDEEEVSDEEEETTSEEESSEEESDDEAGLTGAKQYLRGAADLDESDEEEDRVTIVKSAKDKRLEELEGTMKLIENAEKINDWAVISTEFDKLNRQVAKIIQAGPTPKIYIKAIADLEDFVNETVVKQKTTTKKMNASNAKGFNTVKQRIKKNNKDYTAEIEKYRENKDEYLEEEEEQETVIVEKKARTIRIEDTLAQSDEGFSTVGRGGRTLQYTPESILKHLRVIVESRGKKNTDRIEQIKVMEKLLEVASSPYHTIRILLTLISTRFDLATSSLSNYMSTEQ
ncbi:eukaryotic translation initiation factor 3 subunit C [Coccidioides immitis H538.4]|nr:eukaryotic translation initiation factor 3 subunit C [Coccidioides immitis H538.4]